jgi:hypothetical protein
MADEINPRLGIARSVASRTYLVIARAILAHPGMQRAIKTYNVPGVQGKFQLADQFMNPDWFPAPEQAPSLWMWPEPRDGQPATNANQSATMNVNIELYAIGPDPTDTMDLWGLIEEVVNPRTIAAASALAAEIGEVSRWGTPVISQPGLVSFNTDAGLVSRLTASVSTNYRIQGFGGI